MNTQLLGDRTPRKRIPYGTDIHNKKYAELDKKQRLEEARAEKELKEVKESTNKQESTSNSVTPVTTKANITPEDYIQIPNTNLLISKYEPDEFKELNWQETHFKLAENGLFMPTPAIFMPYFKQVRDNNVNLVDGNGKRLSDNEIIDIYKHLTKDHINGGAWSWLDVKFNAGKIETDHRIVNGNLQGQNYDLESQIGEDCYVDLEFNKQGLPTKKSNKQDYIQGENIYYWKPVNGRVARFSADSDGAYLYCGRNPDGRDGSLGVFACCEATQKNDGGK